MQHDDIIVVKATSNACQHVKLIKKAPCPTFVTFPIHRIDIKGVEYRYKELVHQKYLVSILNSSGPNLILSDVTVRCVIESGGGRPAIKDLVQII